MSFLNCKYLRRIVSVAGIFLIGGMLLEVVAHLLASDINLLLIQPIALGLVLISPVIILATVVVSLIPGVSLKDCIR
ncbi:MAG: hypothetical protein ABW157_22080 [Candidatus Thiodiazotropha sp. LLP2]